MDTALRKLSADRKLRGKGQGKLTAKKCQTLQNYYRGAILSNQESLDKKKAEILAGLLHSMSSDDNPLHIHAIHPGVGIGEQRRMKKGRDP